MNIIDKIIGWFNPEAGATREAWRQIMEEQRRNYDAGNGSRLNANWRVFNQSAEYTDRYSRDTVRARARDLERNSDIANSLIGPFVRNVVGKGLILQADTPSEKLNGEIEKLWKTWCKKRNCDVTGTQSLNQMLRMIGAGQGLSYEATSRDMSQCTYSSARQGLIEDGMTYAEEDELLAEILDEIYETFIISAVLAGAVSIPDFWNRKDEYFRHSFEKPPKDWIDPSKEATATKIALMTGQKTFKQIAAENGADWRKQIDDICEVLDYAREEHGVDLGGVILGQKKSDGLYEDEPAESAPPPGGGQIPAVPPDGGQNPEPDGDGDTDGEAGEE